MKALWWSVGAVILLVVAVGAMWGIGALLPVEHRATVTRILPVDADLVWRRIDRVERWPDWRDAQVELLASDSVRVTEAGETLVYRLDRPGGRTLVTEIVTPGIPYGGRWTWSVAPAGDSAVAVTIVEDGEVYDPFFRFFSRFVFGHESTIRSVLDALEASFESSSAGLDG